MKNKRILIPIVFLFFLIAVGCAYISDYYHATKDVQSFFTDSENVQVIDSADGLFLDGPGKETALVFYPGGKVEYTSYIPLLHQIASGGTDCFLVRMPMNLAVFGKNKASDLMTAHRYSKWYLAGHSLGGAVAAMYAEEHDLEGLILLAAYPTGPISVRTLELYGSEDGVLNRKKRDEGDSYLPSGSVVEVIKGGNHAQFGNYGEQKRDGTALISRLEQQRVTSQKILTFIGSGA